MKKNYSKNLPPIKQLALFVQKAKQLKKLDCFDFLSNYKSAITVSWKQGSETKIDKLIKPEENAYRSYLIDFRQFLLNESDTQVNKILNMSIRQARHKALLENLIELKQNLKEINKYLRGLNTQTKDSETNISGSELFNLWLNGTIFHHDVEAYELFSSLGILNDLTEINFTKYIGLYSNFIIRLSLIIESGLNTNGFDVLNKLSPHFDAKFVLEVNDSEKPAVIRFWKGTKDIPQTLAICEDHDQDVVILVDNFDESRVSLEETKVELKACCKNATEIALSRIHQAKAWIDHVEKHGQPKQNKLIEILELPITDKNDIQTIKMALEDYRLIWRRKIGRMRCIIHHMPPGIRGFGVDLFMQSNGNHDNFVFLQGCCREFIQEFFAKLKQ